MMNGLITILLVDDHQVVRQGVRAFLDTQADFSVIAEAESGDEALRLADQHVPDVILMDLVLPGDVDGVEATRQVKRRSPRTQVVVLTSYHEDEYIFPAIRAGALSYVLKDIGPKELADVIRKAARGEAVLH
ncbi:MAG: response regulator transcription factor, partial [Anaerolineales bacterium]